MATIIDSFLVTLGLDTKGMTAGERDAQLSLKRLEHQASESAQHIQEQGAVAGEFYSQLMEKAVTFFAFLTAGSGLKHFVDNMIETMDVTERMSGLLGISVEEIQKWQGAVVISDGTVEGFNSSMKALGGSLIDIEKSLPRSERALKVLQAAGVTGLAKGKKSDLLGVIDQLSEKMSGMSRMEALRLGSRIGLDEAFIRVLYQGKSGIAELKDQVEKLGMFTKEEAEEAGKLQEKFHVLGLAGSSLARETIMGMIIPALNVVTELVLSLGRYAHEHPNEMKAIFVGLAAGLGVAAVMATTLVLSMSPMLATIAAASAEAALLAAAAYMIYEEWEHWLPLAEEFIPGIGSTVEIAKQGMTELGKMYKEMFTGSEEEAEKAATRYMEKLKDVANRIIREVLWEILDIPYKIIKGLNEVLKGVGSLNPFTADWSNAWGAKSKPEVKGSKHLNPFGVPGVQGADTSYAGSVAGGAGGEWDWRALFRAQQYSSTPTSQAPSIHVDTVQILTSTQDPVEHGSLFADAANDMWTKHLATQSNSGVR